MREKVFCFSLSLTVACVNLSQRMADRGETDDLASLAKLDEATLLEELKRRYTKDKIYVRYRHNLSTAVMIHE